MINKKNFSNLLSKDMTRKEFLQLVGSAIVGVVGLSAFLKNIDKFTDTQAKDASTSGYGNTPYGL